MQSALSSKKVYRDHASKGTGDLAHKIGTLPKGANLNGDALADYMKAFDDPLNQQAIAALSSLFKLDGHLTTQVDDALANHGGLAMLGGEGLHDAPPLADDSPGVPAADLAVA